MVRWNLSALLVLTLLAAAPASSFDLSGDGSRWSAAVNKTPVGHGNGTTYDQWSIAIERNGSVAYESPRDGGPLTKVTKGHGADMWFPSQSAQIVGAAPLMGTSAQQLVVDSHETGADCGSATVSIFRYDAASHKIVPAATVQNGCELTAKISGSSVILSGPFYAKNAALCCPTKAKANATLAYRDGKWVETPQYFALYPNSFPRL